MWFWKTYRLQGRSAEILWGRRLSRTKGRDLEGGGVTPPQKKKNKQKGMDIFWKPTIKSVFDTLSMTKIVDKLVVKKPQDVTALHLVNCILSLGH